MIDAVTHIEWLSETDGRFCACGGKPKRVRLMSEKKRSRGCKSVLGYVSKSGALPPAGKLGTARAGWLADVGHSTQPREASSGPLTVPESNIQHNGSNIQPAVLLLNDQLNFPDERYQNIHDRSIVKATLRFDETTLQTTLLRPHIGNHVVGRWAHTNNPEPGTATRRGLTATNAGFKKNVNRATTTVMMKTGQQPQRPSLQPRASNPRN